MRRAVAVAVLTASALVMGLSMLWQPHQRHQPSEVTAAVATVATTSAKAAEAADTRGSSANLRSDLPGPVVPVVPGAVPAPGRRHGASVAVMVVGQWRWFTDTLDTGAAKGSRNLALRSMSAKVMKKLKEDGISSVLTSQLLHVLRPLQRHGDVPEFLLCVDQVKDHLADIAEAWAFPAKDQYQRIKECLKRVLLREERVNNSYDFFVRLRPDLLLLSDLPWTRDASCVGARLRAARYIGGLTSEHFSWCYCGTSCCAKGVLKVTAESPSSAAYIADDMVTVASRATFLELWQKAKVPASFSAPWIMQPMAESTFTRRILERGLSVCPLALRALPIGSANPHASEMAKCGYLEGSAAIPQSCGAAKASVDKVPK